MKKLLSIALTGALVLSTGAFCPAPKFSTVADDSTEGTYKMLTYRKYADCVLISDCNPLANGEIVIPETIDDLPVTLIGWQSFCGCSVIKSVIIPDSVTEIGGNAFLGCTSLESVTIMNPYCIIADGGGTFIDTATIYGYEHSTAQGYAEKYDREFVAIDGQTTETTKGDVNGDNTVTIADAVAILQYLANSDEYALSEQGLKNADVLGDDGVNTEDALQIQKLDAGVIDKL